jgi:hypothetical protein
MTSWRGGLFVSMLAVFAALAVVAPALAAAGSISGTVADESHVGIEGVQVCARIEPFTVEETCAETNAAGAYALAGLQQGSYKVSFHETRNRNYVDQYYNGKDEFGTADPLPVGSAQDLTGVDAEMHPGGTIAGSITDAISMDPVANFPVCAFASTPLGEVGRCSYTDPSGNYAINGLPPEDYQVEFLGEGSFNYLTQYYDDASSSGGATLVKIEGPGDVEASINAALEVGAEISGTLTEVGTHKPLANVRVALLEPVTEEVLRFVPTDSAGRYAFRGRPAGAYVVGFSHTLFGPMNADCYSAQYYKGAATFSAATPLTVAPPQVLAGIDGEVANRCPETHSQPVKVTLIERVQSPATLSRCHKGFHRKWVGGKRRCVRKQRKHHRRHEHSPHAHATGKN